LAIDAKRHLPLSARILISQAHPHPQALLIRRPAFCILFRLLQSGVRHKRVMEFSFQAKKTTWKWQMDLMSGIGLSYAQMPISGICT